MKDIEITDHISTQGRAVARAIEALGTIESTGRLIGDCGHNKHSLKWYNFLGELLMHGEPVMV